MLLFKQAYKGRNTVVDLDESGISERFEEVMFLLHMEHDLDPDVLAAADDVLRVFRAREAKNVDID
jgi:hypothetical protein